MPNTRNKPASKLAPAARIKTALITATLLATLTACSAVEPQKVSLTGIVYNYSQESIVDVRINGQGVGSSDDAKPGGVMGGSGMCCFDLPVGAKQVEVRIEPAVGDGFTTTATIEKWWPDLAHYGVVHVLPGRKVVMQITPSAPSPRKDLLEAQQRALGLPVGVTFRMWSAGPIERIDGKE